MKGSVLISLSVLCIALTSRAGDDLHKQSRFADHHLSRETSGQLSPVTMLVDQATLWSDEGAGTRPSVPDRLSNVASASGQHTIDGPVRLGWVRQHASGLLLSQDFGRAVVQAPEGGVLVAGISDRGGSTWEVAAIKYDAGGGEEWVARVDGVAPVEYCTVDLASDSAGAFTLSVPVRSGGAVVMRTMRYASGGEELWRAECASAGCLRNVPMVNTVDKRGEVYVAGTSTLPGGEHLITVLNYSTLGELEWMSASPVPGAALVLVREILVDESGNTLVLAGSADGEDRPSMVLLKYGPSGDELWRTSESDPGFAEEWPATMILDPDGSVIVAGSCSGRGIPWSLSLAVFSPWGDRVWSWRYAGQKSIDNGAVALARAPDGSVVITGWTTTDAESDDFLTMMLSQDGSERWVARWGSPFLDVDLPMAVALNERGEVFVAGTSCGRGIQYVVIKYASNGAEEWVATYGCDDGRDYAAALALNNDNSLVVTGTSHCQSAAYDIATVRFTAGGQQEWVARYDGMPSSEDRATDLALDEDGNVYVTGASAVDRDIFGPRSDFTTVKYVASGEYAWTRHADASRGWYYGPTVSTDREMSVYVVGTGPASGTGDDFVAIAHSGDGLLRWKAWYDGHARSHDVVKAVDLHPDGGIIVTGHSQGVGSSSDYATVRFDAEGCTEWTARYDAPRGADGVSSDRPVGVVVDGVGSVYVTGTSSCGIGRADYTTVKYDRNGQQQWAARYDGPAALNDIAAALAIDPAGHLIVTGQSYEASTMMDYATVCYDTLGSELWVARFDGGERSMDQPVAVSVDPAGGVVVTGTSVGGDGSCDFATVRYSSRGDELWRARYEGGLDSEDRVAGLAVDSTGNVYVTGSSSGDYVTVAYTSSGQQMWVARFDGGSSSDDRPAAIAVDCAGNVFVAGTTEVPSGKGYTTIKYVQGAVATFDEPVREPESFALMQNYPNPFNPSTTIEYALPIAGCVTLKIYNVLGEEVDTLVGSEQSAGTHRVTWHATGAPSGVYFCRATIGEYVQTQAMVLAR